VNFLHLAGHLGADPEIRYTSNGKKVTVLRLATKTRKNNADETLWWRVTIWGEQYDNMIPYLKKGSPILVFGELSKPEIYTDKNGQPQISLGMTASSISFSPFGKVEKNQQQDAMPKNLSSIGSSNSMENAFDSANDNSDKNFSTNSQDFNDDEIPF
jgi:single-strand DNA-binding protein